MANTAKMNAIRSGIVVAGALAFGYLTLRLGVKPFLERAQESLDKLEPPAPEPTNEFELAEGSGTFSNSYDSFSSNRRIDSSVSSFTM